MYYIVSLVVTLTFIFLIFFYKKEYLNEIIYVDRKSGEKVKENVPGEKWLKWLYYNPFGKLATSILVKRKFLSSYYGSTMDKEESKDKIKDFVDNFNINMDESLESIDSFKTFNEFFYRKLTADARKIDDGDDSIVSPADGKIIAFPDINKLDNFFIKGSEFNLKQFLNDNDLFKKYKDGAMAIIRLAPADYHRYHFPAAGTPSIAKLIDGDYYSVSPYAVKDNIRFLYENKRVITDLEINQNINIAIIEVGATMVGGIEQTYKPGAPIKKGDEKGYFKFGGSTVVLIFPKDTVVFDEDLLENSNNSLETKIMMGEKIGILKNL